MNIVYIFGGLILLVYFVSLINKIVYIKKIYSIDLRNLEQQKRSNVASVRHEMIKNGTMRYSRSGTKIIEEVNRAADENIQRCKLKYRYDLISSITTVVTEIFKK